MATSEKSLDVGKKDNSWVLLQNEKLHTRERSPQYNRDNESLAEMAGVGDGFVHVSVPMSVGEGCEHRAGSDIAGSQGTSTETGVSTETMMGPNTTNPTRAIPSLSLTKSVLDLNERQPSHAYPGSIPGWLDSVNGVGCRFQYPQYELSQTNSTYFQTGKSKASTVASSISLEDNESDHLALSLTLCGVGAWCKSFEATRRY